MQAGSSGDAACLTEVDFLLAVRTRDVKRASQLGLRAKGKLQPKVLQAAMAQALADQSPGMIRAVEAAGLNPSKDVRVTLFVDSGVDVSMRPGSRIIIIAKTPMMRAVEARDEKKVLVLMKAGESPPTLARLVKFGMTSMVRHQLKAGVSPDNREDGGNTPLIEAASGRNLALVEVLLAAGADVNLPGAGAVTPLLAALRGGKPVELALVERLLDAKADSSKSDGVRTPLMEAASRCLPKAVALLLRKGARWDVLPDGGVGHYEEAVVPRLDCPERVTVQVVRALREGGVPMTPLDAAQLGWLRARARESRMLGPELYAAGLPRPEQEQPKSQPPPIGVR
ncbi:ankyrin repeat domain-containing protein [Myxococcus stipitatus]|uniref:ankyrin repeat domain-containing protein n=1 Tax=Myxococcus stipitatus TaxID=83455 RepID=UPI0030CC4EE4